MTDTYWTWNYTNAEPRVAALYDKSVSDQWQAAEALDWTATVDPVAVGRGVGSAMLSPAMLGRLSPSQREGMLAGMGALTFSQLLHGEQGALMVSANLVSRLPSIQMKQAAAAQAADEARHVDVFARYIARIGDVHPPSTSLRRVLEKITTHPLWLAQLVGMQIVVEGIALATFLDLRRTTKCPLLRDMLDLVIKDEARHHAFGKIALKAHVDALAPDDRRALEAFAIELVRLFRNWGTEPEDLMSTAFVMVGAGIDPTDMIKAVQHSAAAGQPLDLSRGMRFAFFAHILPDLEQLGLLAPAEAQRIDATLGARDADLAALDALHGALVR